MIPIRQMFIVLLAFGLMASRTGMANQTETVLEVAVGTLNWDKGKPVGTAVVVISRPIPDSPNGPRGIGVMLHGPPAWNKGKPVWLSGRWVLVHVQGKVDTVPYRNGTRVWWDFWPDRPPVVGGYTVEATLRGQRVTRTIKLTEPKSLPFTAGIAVGRIAQTEVDASWSLVPGAISYAAATYTSKPSLPPVPHNASWFPGNLTYTYTTKTSGTILRTTYGDKPAFVNRVEVYAFNVDLTEIPPRLPAQLNVSWTLSPPFDFPPGNPYALYPPPPPGNRPPPPPPGP